MIRAKFYTKNDSIHMSLKGHAGSAPFGEDLICAGATMMAYTVAQAVQFMYDHGKLKKKPKIYLREGRAVIIATPKDEDYAEALHTFWVAQCGIHVLAGNNPDHVKLEHLTV
jgi:uncharacterized protein YsxB (DUF464 family)